MTDSSYGYAHFSNDNQALHMEEWKDYRINYDDIDTVGLMEATSSLFPQFLLEEEEDGAIPLNSSTFGAKIYKNRNLLKLKVWTDLNVHALRSSATEKKLPDKTLLHSMHFDHDDESEVTIGDFLANGYNSEISKVNPDVSATSSHDDNWLNTSSDFPTHHTFSNIKLRNNSASHVHQTPGVVQTPRVGRTRQPSQDKFQTPITRIMR